MAKVIIEVEVEVNEKKSETDVSKAFEFVSIRIPGYPTVPLPPKDPAPRRLVRNLAEAAGYKLRGIANPNTPVVEKTDGEDKPAA